MSLQLYYMPDHLGASNWYYAATNSITNPGLESAIVHDDTEAYWLLYDQENFRGNVEVIEARGIVRQLKVVSDRVHSVRPIPKINSGIVLFEHTLLGGNMLVVTSPISNLKDYGFNDITTSIIVMGGNWELFADSNYTGKMVTRGPGVYSMPNAGFLGNDILTSLRPV